MEEENWVPIQALFSDLPKDANPEDYEDCREFLKTAWVLARTMRELEVLLDRLYLVQDKMAATLK